MIATLTRYRCPYCSQLIVQMAARAGPGVCPRCLRMSSSSQAAKSSELSVPAWVWGVVAALAACLFLR